ncbi:uncharacterized protein LOC114541692 isoform X2 [Dendronephthya gigantea]|nr:uncharacterized protein LOC114541692 isoform X2 [Dendronephthya gigantea]
MQNSKKTKSIEEPPPVKKQCVSAEEDDAPDDDDVYTTTMIEKQTYCALIPQKFKSLNDLCFSGVLQNCLAVISNVFTPKLAKNGNHFLKISITDPTHYGSYELMWFSKPTEFPNIYRTGEIVLLKGIKCQKYNEIHQILKNFTTNICVIPLDDDPPLMKKARQPLERYESKFGDAIKFLKKWRNSNITATTFSQLDVITTAVEGSSFNFCVKIMKLTELTCDSYCLTVWDGSRPSLQARAREENSNAKANACDVDEEELVDIIVLDQNRSIKKYNLRPLNVLALYDVTLNTDRRLELNMENEESGFTVVKPYCHVARYVPAREQRQEHTWNFKGW